MDDSVEQLSPPTLPRKSIFKNRPTWAAQTANTPTHDDQVDLFNRRDDALARFQQEEAKRRKEKELKVENRGKTTGEEPRPVKKRRVSVSDDEGSSSGVDASVESKPKTPYPNKRFTFNRSLLKSLSNEKSPDPTTSASHNTSKSDTVVISIDDDDEDGNNGKDKQKEGIETNDTLEKPRSGLSEGIATTAVTPVIEENELDSDEEISRLAQRARQRRQQQHNQNIGSFEELEYASPTRSKTLITKEQKPQQQLSDGPDPVLKILVHSDIPNTVPLIVQRKLSQRLKEVKMAWCTKNNISEEMAISISLYWRSRKLYDSSTCRSLGLEVNGDGELYFKGNEQDAGPENAQIEMEAMTAKLMEEKRRSREQKSKPTEEESPEIKKSKPGIKVVLRGQGYSDYKIIVKAHTPIDQLVKVFRSKRNVPGDKEIFLMFDGEKLNEEELIQDTELADMDTIEVHVK